MAEPTTLAVLRATRGHLKGSLTKLVSYTESISISTPLADLKIRYYKVDDLWKEFVASQKSYYTFAETDNYSDPLPELEEFESKILNVKSILLSAISERENAEKSSDLVAQLVTQQKILIETLGNSTFSPKHDDNCLPSVRIDPFSGNYRDWPTFRDIFQSVVKSKPNLSPIRKFQFLISCLRGEALSLLNHLTVCDDSYKQAWDKLEKRYDRPRHIVNNFVDLPSVHNSNVNILRKISDSADEIVRGLTAMSSTTRDPWLIYILINKLDPDTRQAWSEEYFSEDYPSIDQLLDFLDRRGEALESCRPSTSENHRNKRPAIRSMHASTTSTCPKCNGNHSLSQCQSFLDLDVHSRREFVKINKICFNCLRNGHSSARCQSKFRCRSCKSRHHSLVHDESVNGATNTSAYSSNNTSLNHGQTIDFVPQNTSTHHSFDPVGNRYNQTSNNVYQTSNSSSNLPATSSQAVVNNHSIENTQPAIQTLLPTALAKILDINGKYQQVRILIDSGSQVSFITESCAQRLGIKRRNARVPICGIGSTNVGKSRGLLSLVITSCCDLYSISVDTYILSKVTTNLPTISFTIEDWNHLHELDLADPSFNQSKPVDILLGADKAWEILQGQCVKSVQGYPIAQKTLFGWVLAGPLPFANEHCITSNHVHLDIDSILQSFWTIEEVDPKSIISNEDRKIEEHFLQTHRRDSGGKYIVDLPFNSPPRFGNTLNGAVSRLKWMEKRFLNNSDLHQSYSRFLEEYLTLGHMSLVPTSEISKPNVFYLPHHAVLKPDSTSTKLRVVFDGSFKDSNGKCLNDSLMIGPPIQRNLFSVCLRFRRHQFVFTADIVKMFRQIWVSEKDIDFQRIVWRNSSSEPIQHFRLRTVTYGTACAPFLSVRTLEQLAKDYREEFPVASDIVLNDFYVDDVVSGGDTLSEAILKRDSLIKLLEKCGMQLSKWQSNCFELRRGGDSEPFQNVSLDTDADSWTKVLGLYWNSKSDTFSFRLNYNPNDIITKRQILRDIARIFDPLGFLSPSVVKLKILLQELWHRNVNWDDELPWSIASQWKKYREELPDLTQIEIPRTIGLGRKTFQLHAFSDASASAYAAVIYSRYELPNGTFETNILAAKSRVSPLKQLSIPRLELCSAVLLARLLVAVQKSLNVTFENVFAWSDSKVVLSWLSSPPRRWNIFVGNRTAEILNTIPRNRWFHVRSECNPADCASRGILPSQLLRHPLWWKGPQSQWLQETSAKWPIISDIEDHPSCNQEEKKISTQVNLAIADDDHPFESLSTRVSKWYILIRIVARIQRIICKGHKNTLSSSLQLQPQEIFDAKNRIIKWLQDKYFGECIKSFHKYGHFPNNSKIIALSPFLDDQGILRVGGRIEHANVSFNTKHPIIIPKGHIIGKLIVLDAHKRFHHPGISTLFALIRQEYWVIGCRNIIRKITHECMDCFRQRKATINQRMGDLPPQRIHVSRPFAHCGCDYAGPITLKMKSGRKPTFSKGYISLFVCLVTKAIHLELVSDLTTDAFLAAFRRFVARRGKPSHLYSDNGTNFRGSARLLSEMHDLLLSQTHNSLVADSLARDGICWHFNPPSAPHFGGLWEAGVKSVKHHLRRVIGTDILTFEQLYTLLKFVFSYDKSNCTVFCKEMYHVYRLCRNISRSFGSQTQ